METRGILVVLALLMLPLAAAQEDDVTTNESEYDTSVPEGDESYLDEAENGTYEEEAAAPGDAPASSESDPASAGGDGTAAEDPTLGEDDLDTSLPMEDESWLNDDIDGASAGGPAPRTSASTPGPGAFLVVAGAALAVALMRRR